ncbi:hypothetical protein AN644_02630 [Candidatus Epulonipiscium fishelsonii]|nr:hypothetical protein AN644_02630 [Epulopiscium sp. SCG-C06WGA-EpuloA1]
MSKNKDSLKQKFNKEVINTYKRIATEVKYKSSGLLTQINKYGGYEASLKYIMTDANTMDFSVLWEYQRLDLSIEALILKEDYKSLFPDYILEFCKNRLKEYNYAPNKIVPNTPVIKKDLVESTSSEEIKPSYNWNEVDISINMWEEIFLNEKIFTQKNQDLFLRMYLAGGKCIQSLDLSVEDGYSEKYPFKEVVTSLSKRIKTHTKIDPPQIKDEVLWWNIVFVGWFNSNKSFEWTISPKLFAAMDSLNTKNKLITSKITLKMNTDEINKRGEHMEEKPKVKSIDDFVMGLFADISDKEIKPEICDKKIEKENDGTISIDEKVDINSVELNNIIPKDEKANIDSVEPSSIIPKNEKVDIDSVEPSSIIPKDEKVDIDSVELSNIIPKDEKVDTISITSNISVNPEKEDTNIISMEENQKITTIIPIEETIAKIKLWEELKTICLEYYGAICEVCGTDYGYTYGNKFERLIDIHNMKSSNEEYDNLDVNPEEDLVPVCHNCHFIMHTKKPCYTIDEMKQLYEENGM